MGPGSHTTRRWANCVRLATNANLHPAGPASAKVAARPAALTRSRALATRDSRPSPLRAVLSPGPRVNCELYCAACANSPPLPVKRACSLGRSDSRSG
ncbi:Hypothetical predicted protein, partial [Olea europaea subsp. europaea]